MPERLGIKSLHHVTLVVDDLIKSRAFYEKFLGLTPISRPTYDFDGLWYHCSNLEIHLLVAEEHPEPSRRHLAFEVEDFDRVLSSLDRERIHVASGPGIRPHDGRRYVFLHDPAGNLIEINSTE